MKNGILKPDDDTWNELFYFAVNTVQRKDIRITVLRNQLTYVLAWTVSNLQKVDFSGELPACFLPIVNYTDTAVCSSADSVTTPGRTILVDALNKLSFCLHITITHDENFREWIAITANIIDGL